MFNEEECMWQMPSHSSYRHPMRPRAAIGLGYFRYQLSNASLLWAVWRLCRTTAQAAGSPA
jgi:hypothetical protein